MIYHDSYFQRELIGWTFWKAHRVYPNQEWPLAENSLVSHFISFRVISLHFMSCLAPCVLVMAPRR